MPIRPHLQGHRFDAETVRLLGLAFEKALVALQHADGVVSPTRDAVAQKIIELAKAGERDPERLCDTAVQACLQAIAEVLWHGRHRRWVRRARHHDERLLKQDFRFHIALGDNRIRQRLA
jgi:hypothetical protein